MNLIERLRKVANSYARNINHGPGTNASDYLEGQAAAEIERLTAENEAIRKDRDDLLQQALGVEAERDIARMENERLRAALRGIADADGIAFTDGLADRFVQVAKDTLDQQLTKQKE